MSWLCHHLNSLHLFCRLRSIGMNKERALRIAVLWEKVAHPGLYRGHIKRP